MILNKFSSLERREKTTLVIGATLSALIIYVFLLLKPMLSSHQFLQDKLAEKQALNAWLNGVSEVVGKSHTAVNGDIKNLITSLAKEYGINNVRVSEGEIEINRLPTNQVSQLWLFVEGLHNQGLTVKALEIEKKEAYHAMLEYSR